MRWLRKRSSAISRSRLRGVCSLFGINAPALTSEPVLDAVRKYANSTLGTAPVERCLVYCPDALGDHIWSKCVEQSAAIAAHAPQRVHVSSVVPPKTPVCFTSVFTGAQPEQHGIRRPERNVLTCDTLFDAMLRSGKRIAIVAVLNSSIDLLFRNRALDYYSESYDQEVTDRALDVLRANAHHLVVVYHQEYDDLLHRTQPFSEECLQAVANHVASFQRLTQAARAMWSAYNHGVIFAPDHGAHTDPATGKGTHGLDIPEDMSLCHWYGIFNHAQ